MPDDKLTIAQFAAKVKSKYPEYKDVDDTVLAKRIVEKYPEYADKVDFGNTPPTATFATRPKNAPELKANVKGDTPNQKTPIYPTFTGDKPVRHNEIKNLDAQDLVAYVTDQQQQIESLDKDNNFNADPLKKTQQLFLQYTFNQSREKKVYDVVQKSIKGNITPADYEQVKYVAKAAPKVAKQLMTTFNVDVKGDINENHINQYINNVIDAGTVQQQKQYADYGNNSINSLTGVDINKLNDDNYVSQIKDIFTKQKDNALREIDKKYPVRTQITENRSVIKRDNEDAYNAEESKLNKSYSEKINQLGIAAAAAAMKNGERDPFKLGMIRLKFTDPSTYALRQKVGSSKQDGDIKVLGNDVVKMFGSKDDFLRAKDYDKQIDLDHPERRELDVLGKLASEDFKENGNWFLTKPTVFIETADKLADNLSAEDKDFYYNSIRPKYVKQKTIDLPNASGVMNQLTEGAISSTSNMGKAVGDWLGLRSKKDAAQEILDEPFKVTDKAAPNISHTQKVVNGVSNFVGSLLPIIASTEIGGGLLTGGVRSAGVLASDVAKGGRFVEGVANEATNIGLNPGTLKAIPRIASFYSSMYDPALKQGMQMFPNDENKATAYAVVNSALNTAAFELLPKGEKLLGVEANQPIKELLDEAVAKKLSPTEFSGKLANVIYDAASESVKSGIKFSSASTIADIATNALFNPQKFSTGEAWDQAGQVLTHSFLDGALLGGWAGVMKGVSNYNIASRLLPKIGQDAEFTKNVKSFVNTEYINGRISEKERNDRVDVIDALEKANKDVLLASDASIKSTTPMSEGAKNKYVLARANEYLLKAKEQKVDDPVIKNKIKDEIKASEAVREDILNGAEVKDDGEVVNKSQTEGADQTASATETSAEAAPLIKSENGIEPNKRVVQDVSEEETMRQMKPFTDKMVEIEREFENNGYTIETDYDNEIQVRDKKGEQVDPEDLPEHLIGLAGAYESAVAKLGDFDRVALEKQLAESRKVEDAQAEVSDKALPTSRGVTKAAPLNKDTWKEGDIIPANYPMPKRSIKKIDKESGNNLIVTFDDGTKGMIPKDKQGYLGSFKSDVKEESKSKTSDLNSISERYQDGDISTFGDYVKEVESYAKENDNTELIKAVDNYRKEESEDIKLSGRNDMDAAESTFEGIVSSELKKQASLNKEQGQLPDIVLGNEWYRGVNKNNKNQGDRFYSSDESTAHDYAIDKVGDNPTMTKISKDELPKNPLVVGSKEELADIIGYPEESIYDLKGDFDQKAKEYAKSKGHDAIVYESGSMDNPEMHVFESAQHQSGSVVGGDVEAHKQNIPDKFRKEFEAKGVPKEQIDGAIALMEARAKSWASEENGRNPDEWYGRIAELTPEIRKVFDNLLSLQDEQIKQEGIRDSETKGGSKKAQRIGTDAISARTRPQPDKDASRKEAKEKVKDPTKNKSLQAANQYNESVGLPELSSHKYEPSSAEKQKPISDQYEQLQDINSPDYKETEQERQIFNEYKKRYPEIISKYGIKDYKDLVQKSYAKLIEEVEKQFDDLPVKVEFHDGDKNYENSEELLDDVHNFGHLWVFRGGDDHTELGSKTKDKNGLTANDKFRAVHDYFGHSVEGYQFGKNGEENAWIEHSKMFSPLAQWALSSETRGQNSFVNYSGKNEVALEKIKLGSYLKKEGERTGNQEMINDGNALLEEANNEFVYAQQKAMILHPDYTDYSSYYGKSKPTSAEAAPLNKEQPSTGLNRGDEILYHGTKEDFKEFDESKMGGTDEGYFGKGFYFHSDKDRGGYGDIVKAAKVDLKNPLVLPVDNAGKYLYDIIGEKAGLDKSFMNKSPISIIREIGSEEFTKFAKELGYDGVISNYAEGTKEVVAFDKKSIKIVDTIKPKDQSLSPNIEPPSEQTRANEGEKEVTRQSKINDLVERVNIFNKMAKNAKGRENEKGSIRLAARELGLDFDDRKGYLVNSNGKKVIKVNDDKPSLEAKNFDANSYSDETHSHINTVTADEQALNGLSILGNDGRVLSDKQKSAAIQSIRDGKPTNGAKAIYDFIQKAVDDGDIELYDKVTGQRAKVPVSEYFDAFKEPARELTDAEIMDLNFELQQDYLNFIEQDGQDYFHSEAEPVAERQATGDTQETLGTQNPTRPTPEAPTEEVAPEKTTSIKNAVTTEERSQRGLSPVEIQIKKTAPETFNEVKEKIDNGSYDVRTKAKAISESNRTPNTEEQVALLYDRMRLSNEYDAAIKQYEEAVVKGDDVAAQDAKVTIARIEEDININDIAAKKAGRDWGLAGQARQMIIKQDYSLSNLKQRARVANDGKPLTEEQSKQIDDLHKQLVEAQNKLAEYENNQSKKAAEAVVKKIKEKTTKTKSKLDVSNAKVKASLDAVKNSYKEWKEGFNKLGIDPTEQTKRQAKFIADTIKLIGVYAENGVYKFEEIAKDIIKQTGERSKEFIDALKSAYGQFREQTNNDKLDTDDVVSNFANPRHRFSEIIKSKGKDNSIPKEAVPALKEWMKEIVEENPNATPDEIIETIHKDVQGEFPGITEREVRDAISEYGKRSELSKEELDVKMRDLRAQMRLISALEDAEAGQRPLKSGFQRDTPSDKVLELKKKVAAAMKENGVDADPKSPEEQWATALDAYKKRVKNKTEEYQKKLDTGDYTKDKRTPLILDHEARTLRASYERVKGKLDAKIEQLRLANRPLLEKSLGWLAKWGRAVKLTSVATIAKLGSAAAERQLIFSPTEGVVGKVLSKIPGLNKIAAAAPRHGGISVKSEAKSFAEFFSKRVLKDSWEVIKNGKSELDNLYGKHKDFPTEAIEFFGRVHGALKNPVKRAEFERSLQKRAEFCIRKGIDINDPIVQSTITAEAYLDAKRAILMQDNLADKSYRVFLNYLENTKSNYGKLGATLLKVLFPIVKIPINFVGETTSYAGGGLKAMPLIAKAIKNGVEKLSPQEADYIMRNLSKQSVGAGLMALGYLFPNAVGGYYTGKRKDGDLKAGDVSLFGVHIPHYLLHAPGIEVLQVGATLRRVHDEQAKKGKDAAVEALFQSGKGIISQVPFLEETGRLSDAFQNSTTFGVKTGEVVKGIVVPPDLQKIAKNMDEINGEAIKRKPESFIEAIELGIPGLREKVKSEAEKIFEKRSNPKGKSTEEKQQSRKEKKEKEDSLKKLAKQLGIKYIPPR